MTATTDIPQRSLVRGDVRDAEDWFTQTWLPNNGYWGDDGYKYKNCYRCGINMKVKLIKKQRGKDTYDKKEHREFCRDCNHPAFLVAFEDGFYESLHAAA